MTDEQLGLYVDRSNERLQRDFVDRVEAVRIGMVTAQDKKALRQWRTAASRMAPARRSGLGGAALEQAVMTLARTHPQYVAIGAD